MDYDDSLTPEIPSEQPPDAADSGETTVAPSTDPSATSIPIPSLMSNASASTSTIANEAKPDLQLLAVLLKNPDLVFALSAAQADSLSNEDTVKLLDMIKAGAGADLPANTVGLGVKVEERVEVSLPSPTPASNPGMVRLMIRLRATSSYTIDMGPVDPPYVFFLLFFNIYLISQNTIKHQYEETKIEEKNCSIC